ncbi:MAG: hypothetical protein ABH840_02175 [Nanoarchaeota archaeon]
MPKQYLSYCPSQTPVSPSVDQFTCSLTDSFCDRTRQNASSCPLLRDLEKITELNEYLANSPDIPGANQNTPENPFSKS